MENGNLAYKEYCTPEKRKKPQQNKKTNIQARKKALQYITAITVLALSAGYMISTFVAVHETRDEVAVLTKELTELQSQTSQKTFDLDHAIDLEEVEEIATTRLGMQRPEKYQIVYVNVNREDEVQKTAAEVEGASKRLFGWVSDAWSNIVEFFSIK